MLAIEGFLAMVEFGTMGFWIMIVMVSCCMIWLLEFKRSVLATITLIAFLFVLYHTLGITTSWVINNPWKVALSTIIYFFPFSVAFAIFRWWRKTENLADRCEELKYEFLRKHRITEKIIPEEFQEDWQNQIRSAQSYGKLKGLKIDEAGIIPLHPSDYKEEIYLWIFFWPWSLIAFLFDEPVRKIGRAIYRSIRGSLVAISENSFKDIKGDFAPPPEKKKDTGSSRRNRADLLS